MKKKINYYNEPDAMHLEELVDEIFSDYAYRTETRTVTQATCPHYLGYYKNAPLEVYVNRFEMSEVFFGCGNWCNDEDLKRLLVVFYMERGLYPSFKQVQGVSSLIMQLEKL